MQNWKRCCLASSWSSIWSQYLAGESPCLDRESLLYLGWVSCRIKTTSYTAVLIMYWIFRVIPSLANWFRFCSCRGTVVVTVDSRLDTFIIALRMDQHSPENEMYAALPAFFSIKCSLPLKWEVLLLSGWWCWEWGRLLLNFPTEFQHWEQCKTAVD